MHIKIKNIEFEYERELIDPVSANIEYSLILNDNQLEGTVNIKNKDINCNGLLNCQIWEFNRYIHQKIMQSM